MAWIDILTSEIDANSPVNEDLTTKIKGNFDYFKTEEDKIVRAVPVINTLNCNIVIPMENDNAYTYDTFSFYIYIPATTPIFNRLAIWICGKNTYPGTPRRIGLHNITDGTYSNDFNCGTANSWSGQLTLTLSSGSLKAMRFRGYVGVAATGSVYVDNFLAVAYRV